MMKKTMFVFFAIVLSACSSTRYVSFNINVAKQDTEPNKAVFSSLNEVDGPDGVCIYKNGKCDTSEYDFLVNDFRKVYQSEAMARYHASAAKAKAHEMDGCGYWFTDGNIHEHENPYRTKTNNLVLSTYATCSAGNPYYSTTVFYKHEEIGKIRIPNPSYGESNRNYVKRIVPKIALCASKIGFSGRIGGERYKENQKSPSMIEFFKKCDMSY